jgi:hypothetical protein
MILERTSSKFGVATGVPSRHATAREAVRSTMPALAELFLN